MRIKTIPENKEEHYPTAKDRILAERERRQAVCVVQSSELTELETFVMNVIMPTLTKPGFQMSPQLGEIRQMTQAQMKEVQHFRVEREGVGAMEWLEPVDLMCADLDLIQLEQGKAGINCEELETLNAPCCITLEGLWPANGSTEEQKARFPLELKYGLEQVGGEFVSYDTDTGRLTFRCTQFTAPYDVNVVIENPPMQALEPQEDVGSPEIVSTPVMAWRIMGWSLRDRHIVKMALASVKAASR